MSQSLRIAPPSAHPTSTSTAATKSAPSAPGLPDTFRQSPSQSTTTTTTSTHPLEARLTAWHTTQETLKHSLLRRTFGLAEPIRRGMELQLVRDTELSLPGGRSGSVHEDILTGRDAEVGWEDVYGAEGRVVGGEERDGGVHGEMERRVGMGKW